MRLTALLLAFMMAGLPTTLTGLPTTLAGLPTALAGLATAHAEPVASGERRPLLVTVDDLPMTTATAQTPEERARVTAELLTVLGEYDIRAVGLVAWGNVRGSADEALLKQWLDAGHELGNHSHAHFDYTSTDIETYIADIERGRTELAELMAERGETLRFFRFPFLREGDTREKLGAMRLYLAQSGQRNLPVTIDDQDWSFERPWVEARRRNDVAAQDSLARAYQTALRMAIVEFESLGDELFQRQTPQILLLHANQVGAAQWGALFAWLEKTGHRFASAHEVLADSAFTVPHEFIGPYGCSYWDRLLDQRRRDKARKQLRSLMRESAAAWNRGDFEAFCSTYAEDALFFSPSGITRGRQAVLERYHQKYGGNAARGELSFELMEVRLSSGMGSTSWGGARPARIQSASIAAHWTLTYPDTTAQGLTLLVLRPRRDGTWEIVQDASM
jgi:uncharacterized protein (TIGR02246 family)